MSTSQPERLTLDDVVESARSLVADRRRILGITGAPGAGKSTLAAQIVQALGPAAAVLVPMDGFHVDDPELVRLGRRARKGAHDTFDDGGYRSLIERLASQREDPAASVIYAPRFDRDASVSVGSALPVDAAVPLVVTEGNYLLHDGPNWAAARARIDEVWFLAPPEATRLERLVRRHEAHGKSPDEAQRWTHGSDQQNADLIQSTATRADRVITLVD